MADSHELSVKKISPAPFLSNLHQAFGAKNPGYDFIIAAGRRTHFSLWWLGFLYRVPRVLVMRPQGFGYGASLRIIPEHDGIRPNSFTFVTQGPMNRVVAGSAKREPLALIGGTSKHFDWENSSIELQLSNWMKTNPSAKIYDSRRTPPELSTSLETKYGPAFIPWQTCVDGQLSQAIPSAPSIFVTPDSASMVFEAWSTDADVHLADLKPRDTKLSRAILHGPTHRPLKETQKAAEWLIERLQSRQ